MRSRIDRAGAEPDGPAPDPRFDPALLPQHAALLVASAISPEVAAARGYRSVTKKAVLKRYGFGETQRRVPGLLIPVCNAWGEMMLHQLRPDEPRAKDGKALKYETPRGARMALDVPPAARDHLDDPSWPLFITEGARKADAAVSQGLCCVSVCGVWGWRGTNGKGGTVALPDWELVALNRRQVYLVFDSDVTVKPQVQQALARLRSFLQARGAEVLVCLLPSGAGGCKTGLDDFFAAGHTVDDLLATASGNTIVVDGQAPEIEAEVEPLAGEAGAEILDQVCALICLYVVLTGEQRDAAALWLAHTHALDAAEVSPYLAVMSPEMRCGKTTLLKVLAKLGARPWRVISPSEAVVYRKVARDQPTLLLDEIETIFRRGDKTEPLRALLNAGNERGTVVPRCAGANHDQLEEFPIFCAKAFAGIGIDKLPGTVRDRSIPILLNRAAPDEPVQDLRRRELAEKTRPVHDLLKRWAASNLDALEAARPAMPEQLDARAADGWEPLLAIADLAGEAWPERARAAAIALSAAAGKEDESIGVRLLGDIEQIFEHTGSTKIASSELVRQLAADEEAPWGDLRGRPLDVRDLARRLKPYGIRPKKLQLQDTTLQGYERSQFHDAWRRYLPPPHPDRNNRNNGSTTPNPTTPTTGTQPQLFRSENGPDPHNHADVPDVPAKHATATIQDARKLERAIATMLGGLDPGLLIPIPDDYRWAPAPADRQPNIPGIELGRHVPNTASCRYPGHRDSDWKTDGDCWMCGICHPPPPSRQDTDARKPA
jgi:hypothetical protein